MTGEKKGPFGQDDIDWDAALAEWDKKPFEPDVAAEKREQAAAAAKAAAQPPPTGAERPLDAPPHEPAAGKPEAPPGDNEVGPPPAPGTSGPVTLPDFVDGEDDSTRVGTVPVSSDPGRASRGGLGALFRKGEPAPIDVALDDLEAPAPRKKVESDSSIVTSASDVESTANPYAEPMRRPSLVDRSEAVPDGEMFDPFRELEDERTELPTVHPPGLGTHDLAAGTIPKASPLPVVQAPPVEVPEPAVAPRPQAKEPSSARPPPAPAFDPEADTRTHNKPAAGVSAQPAHDAPAQPGDADELRRAMLSKAAWLDAEARTIDDKAAQARALLVVSELLALGGDAEQAATVAAQARDLAPNAAMAQRQARAWLTSKSDLAHVLETGLRSAPTPAAKLHDALFAYELLREENSEAAAKDLDAASHMTHGDARVVAERAAQALSKGETASPSLRVPDVEGLAPLAEGLAVALQLRGVERKDGPSSPNDAARRARAALESSDLGHVVAALADLRAVPELERGATWLASAFAAIEPATRQQGLEWLRALGKDDEVARRALAARAVELGDSSAVDEAVADAQALSPSERVTLAALAGRAYARLAHDLDALEAAGNTALLSAASAVLGVADRTSDDAAVRLRSVRVHAARGAGEPGSRDAVRLARLLASRVGGDELTSAIDAAAAVAPAECRALTLSTAVAEGRSVEVCAALAGWSESQDGRLARALAAGLIAERAGLTERALASYASALDADPTCEAAVRAVAALDTSASLAELLGGVADQTEGVRSALLSLELYAKAPTADALARIQSRGVGLPFGSYLAERVARRSGDEQELLRILRERRAVDADPLELAMDGVREALLVAGTDPALAAARLEEAHRARPADVALRELYERLAVDPPADRAEWRERRAEGLAEPAKAVVLTEAAHEFERRGDADGALRAAKAATAAGGGALARAVLERAEIGAGQTERLAEELLAAARGAETVVARREAYERLADVDAIGRKDAGSALLWNRSILEESPHHLPSLRHVEHALIGARRDDELEPIAAAIAAALAGTGDPECSAHAIIAARLRARVLGDWPGTREMCDLAAAEPEPTPWALRMSNAHARSRQDHASILASTEALIARATQPGEIAALCVRAAEAATALGKDEQAILLLERAAGADAGDGVAWEQLAHAYEKAGSAAKAAEAFESLARSSAVAEHQVAAWYDAAKTWLDAAKDEERGVAALEAVAALDLDHADVFSRLRDLYRSRTSMSELASLLERRIAMVTDPDERVSLEVERGKALTDSGEFEAARAAFDAALAVRPDNADALMAVAELAGKAGDWEGAEQSLVQLARLVQDVEQQKLIYTRLGDIYATHLMNLSRAELALREVLKRAEGDVPTLERLVALYKRQNDPARAIETQQELIASASDPPAKRQRQVELAAIYEEISHDVRKAEQTLEAVRREFPSDVAVLRALAEFYLRHKQHPAMNILLDRAVTDAKRAFQAGRFSPALFETLATAYELRNKKEAARVVHATLAAFLGEPAPLHGAEARACDPRLDDLLAPEVLGPAVRGLFSRVGPALDVAVPFDARRANASPMDPGNAIARTVAALGQAAGVRELRVLVAPIGRACIPVGGREPAVVVGDALLGTGELAPAFLLLRAVKLLQAGVSAFARVSAIESVPLVAALLRALVPQWTCEGPSAAAMAEMTRRLRPGMPAEVDPTVGMMAVEAVGAIGTQLGAVGPAFLAWANRAALLGVGDPAAALQAIAWTQGQAELPPGAERSAWIAKTPAAKDLVGYSVSEPYAELRARLNLVG